jgi:predicted RNase H-like HicB family nuclease
MKYPAKFEPAEEGGFMVEFPDFGWGVPPGDSEQEAKRSARDLLVSLIQSDIQDGKDLPRPEVSPDRIASLGQREGGARHSVSRLGSTQG